MEKSVLVSDVMPYFAVWSGIAVVILTVLLCRQRNFCKKHPELFVKNATNQDANLIRQYNNLSRQAILTALGWAIGILCIVYYFDNSVPSYYGGVIVVFILLTILAFLMKMQN